MFAPRFDALTHVRYPAAAQPNISFGPIASGQSTRMDNIDERSRLSEILGDLTYPAEKWRITACADVYGVDTSVRRALYALPARTYQNEEEVLAALPDSLAVT
jgi:hypothetical protein